MTDKLTGSMFKQMVLNAAAEIESKRQPINDLNVFPVPDGDTGTNMSLTLGAGASEVGPMDSDLLDKVADKVAGALLRGARGNSGVILSLLFRGMSRSFKGKPEADSKAFAAAMVEGVNAAYGAVMKPAEGTILTVSRLASDAAVKCAETESDIEVMLETAIETARLALANTVNQNPVLKKANVVDAGGMGYCCILDGMIKALRGEVVEVSPTSYATSEKADFSQFETEDIRFAYCTEVIIKVETEKDPLVLRDFASRLGDSLVMAADEEYIKLHVHVNDPGAILTESITYGPLEKIKIENMKNQHNEIIFEKSEPAPAETPKEPRKKYGIVTVCAGDGMAEVFSQLGADYIVTGGQTMNPSTEDILKGVEAANAETVFILPNNKNIIMAAQQCADLTDCKTVVIGTKTVPQGISAMLAYDENMDEEEITAAMNETIANVRTAQITYAARNSDFDGHDIAAGEYLCLLESALISNSRDLDTVIESLIEALKSSEPTLITVYYGADVTEDEANALADKLSAAFPDGETAVINGGQPVYYYLISAE